MLTPRRRCRIVLLRRYRPLRLSRHHRQNLHIKLLRYHRYCLVPMCLHRRYLRQIEYRRRRPTRRARQLRLPNRRVRRL